MAKTIREERESGENEESKNISWEGKKDEKRYEILKVRGMEGYQSRERWDDQGDKRDREKGVRESEGSEKNKEEKWWKKNEKRN